MTGPQRFTNPNSPVVHMGPPPDEDRETVARTPNTTPPTPPGHVIGVVRATAELEVTPPPGSGDE